MRHVEEGYPVPIGPPAQPRLGVLGGRFSPPHEAAETYRALVAVLREAPGEVARLAISPGDASRKLADGEPLLSGAALVFDLDATRTVAIRLAEALERRGVTKAAPVRQALSLDRFPLERVLRHAAVGESAFVRTLARILAVDPTVLDLVAQSAVKPALQAWSRQLAPLARGLSWERGYCFVCGARAALAELQGIERSRHLRCGRCGADWRVRRPCCPFCGNEDPSSHGFLHLGERIAKARVEVCGACRGYFKVVVTLDPGPPDEVAVEDLATLSLDYAARSRGYIAYALPRRRRPGKGPGGRERSRKRRPRRAGRDRGAGALRSPDL